VRSAGVPRSILIRRGFNLLYDVHHFVKTLRFLLHCVAGALLFFSLSFANNSPSSLLSPSTHPILPAPSHWKLAWPELHFLFSLILTTVEEHFSPPEPLRLAAYTMASAIQPSSGGYSTGADRQTDGLRGRIPPGTPAASRPAESIQEKSKDKVRLSRWTAL
jgi:hypothetical protein